MPDAGGVLAFGLVFRFYHFQVFCTNKRAHTTHCALKFEFSLHLRRGSPRNNPRAQKKSQITECSAYL